MADDRRCGDLTVASYDRHARTYRERTRVRPGVVHEIRDGFVARLGTGARVLEIGSGGGQDAAALESAGLSVRRTDITPAFVDLLRAEGYEADVLDPLVDDLTDPTTTDGRYDGVWASACLHHVRRGDLPVVLARLLAVTRPGGLLCLSVKAGDGEEWISEGTVDAPRLFVYWSEETMQEVLGGAGWFVERSATNGTEPRQRWLRMWAHRPEG